MEEFSFHQFFIFVELIRIKPPIGKVENHSNFSIVTPFLRKSVRCKIKFNGTKSSLNFKFKILVLCQFLMRDLWELVLDYHYKAIKLNITIPVVVAFVFMKEI